MAAFRRLSRTSFAAALVWGAGGCEMDDDRTLHPAEPGGEAGAAADTLTSGGGGETTGSSESATTVATSTASSTTASVVESGCPDLNENEVADCDETLADNATFDGNAESWQVEPPAEMHWEEVDQQASSGVLVVTHGGSASGEHPSMAGSFQCLTIQPQSRYRFLAETFIPEAHAGASSGISALFYGSSDCSGPPSGVVNTSLQSTAGSWRVLHGSGLAPAHAQSLKLRLAVVQFEPETTAEVRFDNVLVVRD